MGWPKLSKECLWWKVSGKVHIKSCRGGANFVVYNTSYRAMGEKGTFDFFCQTSFKRRAAVTFRYSKSGEPSWETVSLTEAAKIASEKDRIDAGHLENTMIDKKES